MRLCSDSFQWGSISKPPLKYVLHKAYALKHKLQKTQQEHDLLTPTTLHLHAERLYTALFVQYSVQVATVIILTGVFITLPSGQLISQLCTTRLAKTLVKLELQFDLQTKLEQQKFVSIFGVVRVFVTRIYYIQTSVYLTVSFWLQTVNF